MLEHSEGDHPDYKFPVKVEYVGPITPAIKSDLKLIMGRKVSDKEARKFSPETHALIYTDGSIAITLYERCYAMWLLRTGECLGARVWYKKENWKLKKLTSKQLAKALSGQMKRGVLAARIPKKIELDVTEWLNTHQKELARYRGKRIAIHTKLGIVASGQDFETVLGKVKKLGLLGQCVFDVVPPLG